MRCSSALASVRTTCGFKAELRGENVRGEQRDEAAGEAGRDVREEAAVAARGRTRMEGMTAAACHPPVWWSPMPPACRQRR